MVWLTREWSGSPGFGLAHKGTAAQPCLCTDCRGHAWPCRSSQGRGLPDVDEMMDVLDTAGEVQERLSSLLEPPEGQNLQLASLR